MDGLTQFVKYEVAVLLCALALIVVYKMLTLRISLRGLLTDPRTGVFSPSRLQLLLFTIGAAVVYFDEVLKASDSSRLPDPSPELLAAVGASQAVYLSGKGWRQLIGFLTSRQ